MTNAGVRVSGWKQGLCAGVAMKRVALSTGALLGGESLEDEARRGMRYLTLSPFSTWEGEANELTWWERSASIRMTKLPVACFTPWMYAVPATTEHCSTEERLELTELSLTYLIQALLFLDVVPNGERGRRGGGRRERGEEGRKR